jgi:hypothetical protein
MLATVHPIGKEDFAELSPRDCRGMASFTVSQPILNVPTETFPRTKVPVCARHHVGM